MFEKHFSKTRKLLFCRFIHNIRIGRLLVEVLQQGRVSRRTIRTGRVLGTNVEVLSGLREGEQVVLPEASGAPEAPHE